MSQFHNAIAYKRNTGRYLPLLISFDWKCAYRGKDLTPSTVTIDHFEPEHRGGTHGDLNLVPCCRPCNSSKSNKPFIVWLAMRPDPRERVRQYWRKMYGNDVELA